MNTWRGAFWSWAMAVSCALLLSACGIRDRAAAGPAARPGSGTGGQGTGGTTAGTGGATAATGGQFGTGVRWVDHRHGRRSPARAAQASRVGAARRAAAPPPVGRPGTRPAAPGRPAARTTAAPAAGPPAVAVVASNCVGKAWPTADPTMAGPFAVTADKDVGPAGGRPARPRVRQHAAALQRLPAHQPGHQRVLPPDPRLEQRPHRQPRAESPAVCHGRRPVLRQLHRC